MLPPPPTSPHPTPVNLLQSHFRGLSWSVENLLQGCGGRRGSVTGIDFRFILTFCTSTCSKFLHTKDAPCPLIFPIFPPPLSASFLLPHPERRLSTDCLAVGPLYFLLCVGYIWDFIFPPTAYIVSKLNSGCHGKKRISET